jgi:hypothetical protein
MAEVTFDLPDDLYRRALAHGLPVADLARDAVEQAVLRVEKSKWVARMRSRPVRCTEVVDTAALLDEVRSEFGTETSARD